MADDKLLVCDLRRAQLALRGFRLGDGASRRRAHDAQGARGGCFLEEILGVEKLHAVDMAWEGGLLRRRRGAVVDDGGHGERDAFSAQNQKRGAGLTEQDRETLFDAGRSRRAGLRKPLTRDSGRLYGTTH